MKIQKRLSLEALEARWCPALTATLASGVLTISGTADNGTIAIAQDATTAGTVTVSDGTTAVTLRPFTGVKSIKLNLTEADDTVAVDLGGQTLAGRITANLGAGANSLSVTNGTLTGGLSVSGDTGNEGGRCGHGGFRGGPGFRGGRGSTTADTGIDTVLIAAGATVGGLSAKAGQGGAAVTVEGEVTGEVSVDALFRGTSSNATTLDLTGEVDGSVRFTGGSLADSLSISGDVGGGVFALTGAGADKVSLSGTVTRGLLLDTGADADTIALSGTVGGRAAVSAGSGDDTLTIDASARFLSTTLISMGAGADSVTLDDAATFTALLINGGTGTDVFTGTATRAGLTLLSF